MADGGGCGEGFKVTNVYTASTVVDKIDPLRHRLCFVRPDWRDDMLK